MLSPSKLVRIGDIMDNRDYDNFVARMGSSEDFIDLDTGEISMTPQELKHYGVLGMKWGRRKGPSAPSSKNVKNMSDDELQKTTQRINREKAYKKATSGPNRLNESANALNNARNLTDNTRKLVSMTPSKNKGGKFKESGTDLSDAELKSRITRMQQEQQYAQLNSNYTSSGKQKVDTVLAVAGTTLAVASSAAALAVSIKTLMDK